MNTAVERLQSLRVSDVMCRDVVTVSANATMAEAATVLSQHDISGVPVVDETDQCVGMLSTTDFVRFGLSKTNSNRPSGSRDEHILVADADSGMFHVESLDKALVKHSMSYALQTICADQSLVDAARYMQCQHVHRVVAIDECARPVGVLSSLDIVAALINSIDEQAAR